MSPRTPIPVRPAGRPASRATRKARRNWTPWYVLAGLVVAAFLLALATVGGNDDADDASTDELLTSTAEVVGDPLPPLGEPGAADPAVGRAVPVAAGVDLTGAPLDIVPGADGPTLVMFVAHWCNFCQREVPVMQELIDSGQLPESLVLLAVTSGIAPAQPNYPPTAWLEREGWTVPTLIDGDDAVAQAYGLSGYPFWVAVDAEGRVLARASGALGADSILQLAEAVAASAASRG